MPRSGSAPMSPGDEEELLRRARSGEAAAYAELRDAHLGPARELARLLAQGDDVDRVVEAAFNRIGDQLASGGGPTEKFGAYVSAMVRDRHRDLLRTRRLEGQESVAPGVPTTTAGATSALPGPVAAAAAAGSEVVSPPEPSPFWEGVRERFVLPEWLLTAWDRLRALPPRPTAAVVAFVLVASAVTTWVVLVSEDPDPPSAEVAVDPEPGGVGAEHRERGGESEPSSASPSATPTDEDESEEEDEVTSPFDLLDPDSPLVVDPTTGLPTLPLPGTDDSPGPGAGPGPAPGGPRPPGTQDPGGDPTAPGPTVVRPVAPKATTISSCDSYGSLSMPSTTGVRYAVASGDGRQGPWRVRATAAAGYVLAAGAPTSFSGNLGEYYACPSLSSVGKSKAGARSYDITASVSAPGPGPRTLEARFVFNDRTEVQGSSGGWSCGGNRTVGAGTPVTCTTVIDGGSPPAVTLRVERMRLLLTVPSGSVTLYEDGTARGSAKF